MKLLYKLQKYDTRPITIGRKKYTAIIADTSTKRAIGLMFRSSLPKNSCMLFIFGFSGRHAIWMQDMKFPIDAAWLDKKGTIIDTRENLKPCKSIFSCPQYSPKGEANYLIELAAGETRRQNLRSGIRAKI